MSVYKTLTEFEIAQIVSYMSREKLGEASNRKQIRNFTMLLLMVDGGLRVGEVVQLDRNDMSFAGIPGEQMVVRASISKSKAERIIPLSPRLKVAIREMNISWWQHDPTNIKMPAFQSKLHGPTLTTRQVQRIINQAGLAALHRPIHPHLLRHTFATNLLRVANTRVVQQMLGHQNLTSTQIYTHPNGEDCRQAIDKMHSPGPVNKPVN